MTPVLLLRKPQRILIVKPSALGDIVHALPVLWLLKKRWPSARISWVVTPAFESLLRGHPMVDDVLVFERKRLASGWKNPSAAAGLMRFGHQLRAGGFDFVLDLQGLFRSGWMTWKTNAKVRIGFDYAREAAPVFYTHRIPTPSPERHAVERYLDIAEALGCGRGPIVYDFGIDNAVRDSARRLAPSAPYAVLLPGTNWETKRWPAARFGALVRPIKELFGLESVVAGGADAAAMIPEIPRAINLTGQTDLRQLVALIEGASLVIGNDSGPMHIAAALGKPLVTVFGPTNPTRTGPHRRPDCVVRLDVPCSPCYSRTCVHTSCMTLLEPRHVLELAARQMDR